MKEHSKERLKSLILVLLLPLTLYLLYETWFLEIWAPKGGVDMDAYTAPWTYTAAALPEKLSQQTGGVRTALMWDASGIERSMRQLSSLLSEALGSAASPSVIDKSAFIARLSYDCVYLEYGSPVPLEALGAWLSVDSALTGTARAILLTTGETGTELCYESSNGVFYASATAASDIFPELGFTNGCYFAFEAPGLPGSPEPLTLLPDNMPSFLSLKTSGSGEPLNLAGGLLQALGFDPNTPFRYVEQDGTLNIIDYRRQCLLSPDGRIYYSNPTNESWFKIHETVPALPGLIESARELCNTLAGALGDARWSFTGASETGGEYRISFGVQAGGCPVLGDNSAYALIIIRESVITEAYFRLRTYRLSDTTEALMPLRISLVTADAPPGYKLRLGYNDGGGETLSPVWMVK